MKLEVGMYVRFKTLSNEVKIGQIQLIDNSIYELDNNEVTADKYIIKASHNIIDLIEVGDVIEVKEFKGKYEVRQFGLELSIVKEDTIYNLNSLLCTLNIKTIVTKEQFEKMQYSLEG